VLTSKRESGSQGHSTTKDKRNLDKLIRSVRKTRFDLLISMERHVSYFLEHHNGVAAVGAQSIPSNWMDAAKEGQPFWSQGNNTPPDTPAKHEVEGIVTSHLKRQRAWEQLTETVPRELRDAMEQFSLLEIQAHTQLQNLSDDDCGMIVVTKDLIQEVRCCRLGCIRTWEHMKGMMVCSPTVAEVTLPSSRHCIQIAGPALRQEHTPPEWQLSHGFLSSPGPGGHAEEAEG